jgi:DNA-binding HxlR family transcriptional regulator
MSKKRLFDDPCGIARALNAVGERWALLVVRELVFGPKRYSDLHRGLPQMSQNVLAQRLRELEADGLVRRRRLGPPASAAVYELTERGQELEPVLRALAHWGSRAPLPEDGAAELSVDALLFALRATFDPALAGELSLRCQLDVAGDRFRITVAGGRLELDRGEHAEPDAWLTVPEAATLRDLVFAGAALHDAVERADTEVAGDTARLAALLRCFPAAVRYPAPQDPGPPDPGPPDPCRRVSGHRTPKSRIPLSAQEVVGGERQSADPGHRWRGYAGRQFRLRGLAELIAETTTHHLDSDPQLNAWRWSTTEHDRLVAVAHPFSLSSCSLTVSGAAGWSCRRSIARR